MAMSDAYDKSLRILAKKVAHDLGVEHVTREGTILSQSGPCFESIAEVRMMGTLGADVVGKGIAYQVQITWIMIINYNLSRVNMCRLRCSGKWHVNFPLTKGVGGAIVRLPSNGKKIM